KSHSAPNPSNPCHHWIPGRFLRIAAVCDDIRHRAPNRVTQTKENKQCNRQSWKIDCESREPENPEGKRLS
ncbi:MAG: hypothetical protein OXI86_02835, partial [Candidatus Poribacteria bacterium]|nr:hypothetical protein [Candidatus Poribacteria bacterium]